MLKWIVSKICDFIKNYCYRVSLGVKLWMCCFVLGKQMMEEKGSSIVFSALKRGSYNEREEREYYLKENKSKLSISKQASKQTNIHLFPPVTSFLLLNLWKWRHLMSTLSKELNYII